MERQIPALEHARTLAALCEPLAQGERTQLALRSVDRCVRCHAPRVIEQAGYAQHADRLRKMNAVSDIRDWPHVRDALQEVVNDIPGDDDQGKDALACLYTLLTLDEQWGENHRPDFCAIIVCTLTAARCAGVFDEDETQRFDATSAITPLS